MLLGTKDSSILLMVIVENIIMNFYSSVYYTSIISKWGAFLTFLSLVMLLLVLQTKFIGSGVKSWG